MGGTSTQQKHFLTALSSNLEWSDPTFSGSMLNFFRPTDRSLSLCDSLLQTKRRKAKLRIQGHVSLRTFTRQVRYQGRASVQGEISGDRRTFQASFSCLCCDTNSISAPVFPTLREVLETKEYLLASLTWSSHQGSGLPLASPLHFGSPQSLQTLVQSLLSASAKEISRGWRQRREKQQMYKSCLLSSLHHRKRPAVQN